MKKILIVEDDFGARRTVEDMLRGVVEEVIAVPDAVNALINLKDHKDIEAIVTDYRLPGLGGKDWIDILRNYHSTMKLVVVSGYEIVKDKLKDDEVKILIKPFTKYQLMELLGL